MKTNGYNDYKHPEASFALSTLNDETIPFLNFGTNSFRNASQLLLIGLLDIANVQMYRTMNLNLLSRAYAVQGGSSHRSLLQPRGRD